MANRGLTQFDDAAAAPARQDLPVPISPASSQDLEWGHLSSVYGDVLQWGELSSATMPRDVFLERHYQQQQQLKQQQQAIEGENFERCNILSTFFGDLLQKCVREEEFARTGPVLRQYLQQQPCSALNLAASFLNGNDQLQADATPAAMPPKADAPYMSAGAPGSQPGPLAPPWPPSSSSPAMRDSVGLPPVAHRRTASSRNTAHSGLAEARQTSDALAGMQGAAGGQGFSLRTILKALDHVPTGCVLMAKKFNRLGSSSVPALQRHFGTFGVVRHILVPDVNACQVWQRTGRRRKPANQAFVIMADAGAVDRALAAQKHVVQGQAVQVTRFEHHDSTAPKPADSAEAPTGETAESADISQAAAEASVAQCVDTLKGGASWDGYGRQISSASDETTWSPTPFERNISSSSDDERPTGNGGWMDVSEGSGYDQYEITGDFEYWETDNEGF